MNPYTSAFKSTLYFSLLPPKIKSKVLIACYIIEQMKYPFMKNEY